MTLLPHEHRTLSALSESGDSILKRKSVHVFVDLLAGVAFGVFAFFESMDGIEWVEILMALLWFVLAFAEYMNLKRLRLIQKLGRELEAADPNWVANATPSEGS